MSWRKRDTTALAVGSLANGLLAYAFFAIAARAVGPVAAAPLSVLWTYWTFVAAALTFPLQHWIARAVAAGEEATVRRTLPRVGAGLVAVSAAVTLITWLARDQLFHRDDAWFPLLTGAVTFGSGFIGIVRGGLAARNRFIPLAVSLTLEGALRCVTSLGLALAGVGAAEWYGLALVVGPVVGMLWPESLRFSAVGHGYHARSHLRFLSGAGSGQLMAQLVLTGGPVLLTLSGGGAADVTALFAVLALFRAPYTLVLGLVAQLTGRLTVLVVNRRRAALARARVAVVAGTAITSLIAAGIAAAVGPDLTQIVFGEDIRLETLPTVLVAIGSAVALANLAVTITVMAYSRTGAVVRAWTVAIVAGAACFGLADLPLLDRTAATFLTAEVAAFAALLAADVLGWHRLASAPPVSSSA